MISVKFKFEDKPKIYDFELKPKEELVDKQARLVGELLGVKEESAYYHLYNPDLNKYVEGSAELQKSKITYLMKNTSKEAQMAVTLIRKTLYEKKQNDGKLDAAKATDIKSLVFNLKNYLTVDSYAEEFIAFGGLEGMIEIIQEMTGNTRSYAINSLKSILVFRNAIEYIRENAVVVHNLYYILVGNESWEAASITITIHTLGILFLLCDILKDEGVSMILHAAEKASEENDTKLFQELVKFLYNVDVQVKVNAMTLIFVMIKSCSKKSKQSKILAALNEADLILALNKFGDLRNDEFQNQLSNFQKLTGEIIKGSNYEIELYKIKYKEIENHCYHLEKKVEYIFLNQRFYTEIVEDFVTFQQMAETALEIGGYYDPSK